MNLIQKIKRLVDYITCKDLDRQLNENTGHYKYKGEFRN